MHKDYLVVFNVAFDDKVQRAIKEVNAKPNGITLDDFIKIFEENTKAPSLTMILDGLDPRITQEGRADFLRSSTARDAAIYPINEDGTIDFKNGIYGINVDPMYLQN